MKQRHQSKEAPLAPHETEPPRGVHDLGGLAAGQVDTHEHQPTLTERRIDAMMGLLRDDKRRLWRTDENRRTIESMTPRMYEGSGYYERWVRAMAALLVEKGVLTEAEIAARVEAARARHAQVAQPRTGRESKSSSGKPADRKAQAVAKPRGASKGKART